jgi:hypothetical protein
VTLYFAYGANMDPVHMAERCPAAQHLGVASLPGHRFGIAAGGYGMVRPESGMAVRGVLWRLTPADVAALDDFEGVESGFYRKDFTKVEDRNGAVIDAMIYRPADESPGRAAPGYLERIIEVCRELEFPPEYVAGLEAQRVSRSSDLSL